MRSFPKPSKGGSLLDWAAQAWEAIRRNQVKAGPGILLRQTTDGVIISARPGKKGVSAIIGKLLIAPGSEAGKYRITDGVVNSETPTLGGVDIGGDPAADPVVPAPEFTVTATTYAWIKCVGTFGSPDTFVVNIETTTDAGVPTGEEITATTFTSFRPIGRVAFVAGSPATYTIHNTHGGGNFGVDSFGNVNLWWLQ